MATRINISLVPSPGFQDWDIHIPVPFLLAQKEKPAHDKSVNPTDARILRHFECIDKKHPITITDNGGPIPWAQRIHSVLEKAGYNSSIDTLECRELFDNQFDLFPDEATPVKWLDTKEFQHDFQTLFRLYWQRSWELEESAGTICGHRRHANAIWTQVNAAYDPGKSRNLELMTEMKSLFERLVPWFSEMLDRYDIKIHNLQDRLTLRLIHYENTEQGRSTVKDHVDASVITTILAQDEPGFGYYKFESKHNLKLESAEWINADQQLHDQSICFPGVLFKDELKTWVPPVWHGVHLSEDNIDRLSLVFRVEESQRL